MGTVFHVLGGAIHPAPGTRIVRAGEYATLLSADEILEYARAEALRIQKDAQAVYEEQKKKGYEDGIAEGQMQQAEKMLETGLQAVEYLEGLERKIVEVVTIALRKILGELDDKERIVRIVRNALDQVRGRQHVLIRVCPEEEGFVREALSPMLSRVSSAQSLLDVVADTRLNRGACLLESDMGVIDASLEVQLKAIETSLMSRIGEAGGK
ncbi:MAG: HrpE/YscL family type III secretion apparatus protein [Desulfovibrionaceae bacterium]|nr:HrpE/YscL family type III secretion apparatus protein [Desulfovibrionaceae bacterium]